MDGGAGAGAVGQVARQVGDAAARRVPSRRGELHRVLDERGVHIPASAFTLNRPKLLGRGHSSNLLGDAGDPVDDDKFFLLAGVADQHLHHKPVHLRLGQRVSPLGFDRILSGHDQKRLRHPVGLAGDGDLVLLHHLEQRALHLCRRSVDLIGQQKVGEDGTQRRAEFAGLLVVDAGSHQIRRDEIRRELNSTELSADGSGEGLDREGLGQARNSLHEQVPLRQDGHQHAFEEMILADDDLLHFVEDALHQ